MKRLLLVPLLVTLLLTSCSRNKYNSSYEAEEACREWESNGFRYSYEDDDYVRKNGVAVYPYKYTVRVKSRASRRCIYEYETRQYIGKENISVKKNAFIKYDDWQKLEKNIKYKYKNFYF